MLLQRLFTLATSLLFIPTVFAVTWNGTEYMIVFGDSYTADGYNISAGIDSPTPGWTSAGGPNWVEFLTNTYNETAVKTFNLAFGGATIDSALVPPHMPTVLSVVDQVAQFSKYLASKPAGAQWDSGNTLFTLWIGINDVGTSVGWTNITTHRDFNGIVMNRLFSQVEILYEAGGRNFLFMTVPPTNRAPVFLELGGDLAAQLADDIADYNGQLTRRVYNFQANHPDLESVMLFDTQPIFNTLLDNAQVFGFVNHTGHCTAYEYGAPNGSNYQVEGCAPVSSYFWLNSLHPMFTVHNFLAQAIMTALADYPSDQIST